MVAAVRLGNHELAADQLHRLALEETEVDEPLVLPTLPVPGGQGLLLHGFEISPIRSGEQCRQGGPWVARAPFRSGMLKFATALVSLVVLTSCASTTGEFRPPAPPAARA